MEINELILLIFLPLLISLMNVFLPGIMQKLLTLGGLIFQLYLVYLLYLDPGKTILLFDESVFLINQPGLFTIIFIQLLSLVIFIFSLKGVDKDIERRFNILYPLTVGVCNGTVLSGNIIGLFIFWGLSGAVLYLFGVLGKTQDAPKTAKKTFIIVGGSDVLLILGFVLIWHIIPVKSWNLNDINIPLHSGISYIAFFCILIAAFAKAGGFPFHTWVPDFSRDAPIESAALLPASLDKLLGIYLLTRMIIDFFIVPLIINLVIISLGTLTVVTAVMMAMTQHNGRRLLGYHAVSQVGYMIIGIGSGSALAFAGGLFHLINHTIYKSGLFLTMGSVEKATKTSELDYLGGLGKKMPLTFLMTLIFAFSISGIPPFNGFFSKWMIYQGLIEKIKGTAEIYQIWMLVCLILALFGSALTLASFIKFLHSVFLGRRPSVLDNLTEAPANQWIPSAVLSFLCILFGLAAVEIPLNRLIYPVLSESGLSQPEFTGMYNPGLLLFFFAVAISAGIVILVFTIKPRSDDVYIGGMTSAEKFRITGTEFYNEVISMSFLKSFYNWAEKKYFDIYELGAKITFSFSGALQKAHPGELQLYLLYIVVTMLIFILIV